jgi:4'-phosphopantetheinyl transferase EntD
MCLHAPVHDATRLLSAAEAAAVSRAVPKRRHEYATARWLAHSALRALERPVNDLLNGPRREPLWPAGVVGSIAHSDRHAVVLVSRDPQLVAAGIDLEQSGRLSAQLVPRIFTARERAALGDVDPTLLFSAKEAVYKLLFPIVRDYVGFHDVEVDLNLCAEKFNLRYVGKNPACHCVTAARGAFLQIDGCWVTRVMLWRDEAGRVSCG